MEQENDRSMVSASPVLPRDPSQDMDIDQPGAPTQSPSRDTLQSPSRDSPQSLSRNPLRSRSTDSLSDMAVDKPLGGPGNKEDDMMVSREQSPGIRVDPPAGTCHFRYITACLLTLLGLQTDKGKGKALEEN